MKVSLKDWDKMRVIAGLSTFGIAVVMLLVGLVAERVPVYWFPVAIVLICFSFFCFSFFCFFFFCLKRIRYKILFNRYLKKVYQGNVVLLSEKIECWFRRELRSYSEGQRISTAKLIFPRSLLLWYGCYRYLLKERKIIDKRILQDFLGQLTNIKEKNSVAEYGLNSIIKEMELSGELPGESKGTGA